MSGDEFFEGVAAIRLRLDQSDEYAAERRPVGLRARHNAVRLLARQGPRREAVVEQPVPDQRVVVESPPSNLASAAEVSELRAPLDLA